MFSGCEWCSFWHSATGFQWLCGFEPVRQDLRLWPWGGRHYSSFPNPGWLLRLLKLIEVPYQISNEKYDQGLPYYPRGVLQEVSEVLQEISKCWKKYQSVANICCSSYGISSSSVSKHKLYVNILEYNILLKLSISRVQLTSVWMFKQRYVTRYLLRKRFNTADLYL